MANQNSWRDVALRERETADIFKKASEQGRLLHTLFFGTIESGKGSIGVYTELYHLDGKNTIRAVSLMFIAPQNRMNASIFETVSESEIPVQGGFTTQINCMRAAWAVFEISIHIEQEVSKLGNWHILSASAQLRKNEPIFFDCNLQPCSWPSQSRNLLVNSDYYPAGYSICPNCFGQGSSITMAIPKEDYESGLSGYALFSCNKVNGRAACGVCNGSGADYLPWYKGENPEKESCVFISGTGIISIT